MVERGRGASPARRRRAAGLAALAALALALTGCGAAQEEPVRADAGAEGAYPLTVETIHGEVTVPERPERVLALGFASADELLSLGVRPAAVAADPATLEESAPWLAEEVEGIADAGLAQDSGELNLEAVANTRPDLIVAEVYQVQDAGVFEQLNAIAPTVAPPTDSLNPDWDERLTTTAAAVGRTSEAEALIEEIGAEFAEVGASVPDVEEATYQWVRADPDGYVFGNGSLFELFGLRPADNQDNTQTGDPLSRERATDLDADLLAVWAQSAEHREELDGDPLFQSLPAVEAGTVYYADLAFANAINSPAPISLRWLRDELAPVVGELG